MVTSCPVDKWFIIQIATDHLNIQHWFTCYLCIFGPIKHTHTHKLSALYKRLQECLLTNLTRGRSKPGYKCLGFLLLLVRGCLVFRCLLYTIEHTSDLKRC